MKVDLFFRNIRSTDRARIESITTDHLPYSDHNFTSLWSWCKSSTSACFFNEGVILLMQDYTSDEIFLSILLKKEVSDEDLVYLMHLLSRFYPKSKIKYIPEDIAGRLIKLGYPVTLDEDNFDYILSVKKLARLQNSEMATIRNMKNRFLAKYDKGNINFVEIDDANDFFFKKKNEIYNRKEKKAMTEYFRYQLTENSLDTEQLGLFIDKKIVGFCFYEIINSDYALFHFQKTDTLYKGAAHYLVNAMASILEEKNIKYINFEQDLGIEGLRYFKKSLKPEFFLKKYQISL
jgi:hypothetical protein